MQYVEDCLICIDGVKISDWALLEVLVCDWSMMWSAVKKPQVLLEDKYRIEKMHGQITQYDLEYLMTCRFF